MPLKQMLIMSDDGLPKFEGLSAPLWANGSLRPGVEVEQPLYECQALEVKKGTLVFFHGNTMHKSGTNESGNNRVAYTFSIVEGGTECPSDTYWDFESL